jgi:hypothetical protein
MRKRAYAKAEKEYTKVTLDIKCSKRRNIERICDA